MDAETIKLVIINAPNYAGLLWLGIQQWRIIDRLLKIVEEGADKQE